MLRLLHQKSKFTNKKFNNFLYQQKYLLHSGNTLKTSCGLTIQTDLPHTFNKILIANRGEIACRIIRTCRELGTKTVAVYSDADANSLHVHLADEAYHIGPSEAIHSYLQLPKLIKVAKECKAEAIHPGYGFLSENPLFPEECKKVGIKFIGPTSNAMKKMGNKSESKKIMKEAGVPVTPGYYGTDQSLEKFMEEAEKIGYPVMLKAVSGGGGKGIRPVFKPDEFASHFTTTKHEAKQAFNNDHILIEKFIPSARHIEFQIFGDEHGNVVHCYERDCSVQRSNQKVFEESPAPGLSDELRQQMGNSAVQAAKAVGYLGAGTVEFLVDPITMKYYFMEMNTRLQVEHPVTEMLINRDLVQWQLQVAAGYELPVTNQSNIIPSGHIIEARIYAEDPVELLPSSGKLHYLSFPKSEYNSIRVETGVRPQDNVSTFYDAMIAKLIVKSNDREHALSKMSDNLSKIRVSGLETNIDFLKRIVNHSAFKVGGVTTNFIQKNSNDLKKLNQMNNKAIAIAALANNIATRFKSYNSIDDEPWLRPDFLGYRVNSEHKSTVHMKPLYKDQNKESLNLTYKVNIIYGKSGNYIVNIDETTYKINTITWENLNNNNNNNNNNNSSSAYRMRLELHDQKFNADIVSYDNNITIFLTGNEEITATRYDFEFPYFELQYPPQYEQALGGLVIKDISQNSSPVVMVRSPMPSTVESVEINENDTVKEGQLLCKIYSMKMLHEVKATCNGVVTSVLCQTGSSVEKNQLLLKIAKEEQKQD